MARISELPQWTGELPPNVQIPATISGITYQISGNIGGTPFSFAISSDESYLEIYVNGVYQGKVPINS